MAIEEVAAHLHLGFVHPYVVAVTTHQPVPAHPSQQGADVVADDGGRTRHHHDPDDVQPMAGSGEECGGDEGGLAWDRHPETLGADRHKDGPVAVLFEQVTDGEGEHQASDSIWSESWSESFDERSPDSTVWCNHGPPATSTITNTEPRTQRRGS